MNETIEQRLDEILDTFIDHIVIAKGIWTRSKSFTQYQIRLLAAHTQAKQAILRLQDLARIDELQNTKPPFGGDHSECPEPMTCIGYQNAESDLYNESLNRIAQLTPKENK